MRQQKEYMEAQAAQRKFDREAYMERFRIMIEFASKTIIANIEKALRK